MAKKIRFPLEMENNVQVRTLEELQENFSLEKVLFYLDNGKLITWLKDRYLDEIADEISELNLEDAQLNRKLCKIFDVEYDASSEIDMELVAERNRKFALLKEYRYEKEDYKDVIDQIAFEQDDVYDLLDEDITVIYLCGEKFSIPLGKKGIHYVGINKPIIIISSKEKVNFEEKGIVLENIVFDEKYQAILNTELEQTKFKKSCYKIIEKRIEEKDFEKYDISSYYNDEKGQKFTTLSILIDINTNEEIHHEVVEFVEDDKNVYFLCGDRWGYGVYANTSGIYHKQTKEKKIYSLKEVIDNNVLFRNIDIWPKKKNVSITDKKIYFFKNQGICQSNHDGTDVRMVYGIQPIRDGKNNILGKVHCIFIDKRFVYYAKENGDRRGISALSYSGSLTLCVFDIKTGKEELLHQKVHKIAIYNQFMYLLEEKETECVLYQVEIERHKCEKVLDIKTQECIWDFYVKNNYLMYDTSNKKQERIAEIDVDYGILSKEDYEMLGFAENKLEGNNLQKETIGQVYHVELVKGNASDALIAWKDSWADNFKITNECYSYDVDGKFVFYVKSFGVFCRYNLEKRENEILNIKVEQNCFAVKNGIIYYRVYKEMWDREYYTYYKRIFMADYDGNSLGEISYRFEKEVYNVFKYNDVIYAVEDLCEKNIIYLAENGQWKVLVDKVNAYYFKENFLYYVIDDIRSNRYGSNVFHVFYRINISTKETKKLNEIKFDTSGVSRNGDGFMRKIRVDNEKIYYEESNNLYGREKVFDLKE